MKLQHILGAMCLAGLGNFAIAGASSAAATPTTIAKPSRSDITAAITEVTQIGDYQTHFANSAHPLDATTEFYQEYNYLLGLVTTAENLLADYDYASAKDLNMIIAAAADAKIACNLLFGTARQTKTVAHTSSQSTAVNTTPAKAPAANASAATGQAKTTKATKISPSTESTVAKTTTSSANKTSEPATTGNLTIAVRVLGPESAVADDASSEATSVNDASTAEDGTLTTDTEDNAAATPATTLAHATTATVTSCAVGALYLQDRRRH